jgi:hypothetical protein
MFGREPSEHSLPDMNRCVKEGEQPYRDHRIISVEGAQLLRHHVALLLRLQHACGCVVGEQFGKSAKPSLGSNPNEPADTPCISPSCHHPPTNKAAQDGRNSKGS